MCRNIKTLFNFESPATDDEVRASSIQFVRKISGSTNPSMANRPAFDHAVDEVAAAVTKLLESLEPVSNIRMAAKRSLRGAM